MSWSPNLQPKWWWYAFLTTAVMLHFCDANVTSPQTGLLTQFRGIYLIWNQKMIQFTRHISDKYDLRSCYMWLVMEKSISATVHEIYLHACILPTIPREISANKNKAFYVKSLDILKWLYLNVQTDFQIELIACRHTVTSDKLLFLPYFA